MATLLEAPRWEPTPEYRCSDLGHDWNANAQAIQASLRSVLVFLRVTTLFSRDTPLDWYVILSKLTLILASFVAHDASIFRVTRGVYIVMIQKSVRHEADNGRHAEGKACKISAASDSCPSSDTNTVKYRLVGW